MKKSDRLPLSVSDGESQLPGPLRLPLSDASEHDEDDEGFIRAAFRADPKAGLELLFRRYYPPMCTHAVKFVGSKEAAEDLVGDIFCQFYATSGHLRVTTSYRFYLFRSVRNRAFNYLKWELGRRTSLDEAFDPASPEQQPDVLTQFEELYQDVEAAVNTLPVDRRQIYLMKRFDGKKAQEIADELRLSVRTVEGQVLRATQQIRALLKDKWLLLPLVVGLLS